MGRGFGIASTIERDTIGAVAHEAERLGYSSFWVNDIPGGDGLEALAAAAAKTQSIRLATGVLGLARHTPESIAARIVQLRLPLDRLVIGVGTGGGARPLALVRAGVADLQQRLPAPVIVAATGPKMRALAGEVADGALFNWPVPASARDAAHMVRQAAERAGHPRPMLAAYVRCALLPHTRQRIDAEIEQYGRYYGAQLSPYGASARDAVIASTDAATLRARLAEFEPFLEETVVRAITPDDRAESLLDLLRACAPR